MKVTALIPDDLITEVKELAVGKNLTESLILALKEWTSIQKLRVIREKVGKKPLEFSNNFSALYVRDINRS
ncbi:MAG: hypothetical protein JW913_09735 [Chitinispirillaceae bacterium]|nr:hypothetical protein [Chitinispirillaceae bacterium]